MDRQGLYPPNSQTFTPVRAGIRQRCSGAAEAGVKRLCFDDTVLSFAFCTLVAVLSCVGIAAWPVVPLDAGTLPVPVAGASSAPVAISSAPRVASASAPLLASR